MKRDSDINSKEKFLPSTYISPWALLIRDLKAALADLKLRLMRVFRHNKEGDLPTPNFWPYSYSSYFWPFLILFTLLCIALSILFFTRRVPDTNFPATSLKQTNSIKSLNKASSFKTNEKLIYQSVQKPQDQSFSIRKDSLKEDDEIRMILNDNIDQLQDKISFVDKNSLNNGLILGVNKFWSDLDVLEKEIIVNSLYENIKQIGYEKFEIRSESGEILARGPRIGNQMIIFEQDFD